MVIDIYEDQDFKCRQCKTEVFSGTSSNSDVDHIVVLQHGGSSSRGNLQVTCVTSHHRITAVECKKVMTLMGDPEVSWGDDLYLVNTHVHFDFQKGTLETSDPKLFLERVSSTASLCRLV